MSTHNGHVPMVVSANFPSNIGQFSVSRTGSVPVMQSQILSAPTNMRGSSDLSRTSGEQDTIVKLTEIVGQLQKKIKQLSERHDHQRTNWNSRQSDACSTYQELLSSDREASQEPDFVYRKKTKHRNVKIPPYTGKEDWSVWFCRFQEVADRYNWTTDDKLDQLLPRLHEDAADFAYGQLSKESRSSYKRLTKELANRFRTIETRRTYLSKCNNRAQKPGERVEDYAADLKRLYIKAHPE